MRRPIALGWLFLLLAGLPAAAAWQFVWSDNFERPELGTNWFVRHGSARLIGGRLHLDGSGATLLTERTFGPDVKIEFTAEANPDLPPCDLSATLCANRLFGWDYLFAFGGNHNQLNQILGGSQPVIDRKPKQLIQPGRKYRIAAEKEGRRLTLRVDGQTLLTTEDDDPVGGPGFDRVGLVTWNGMRVDEVQVYERTQPAPDGPRVMRALPDTGWRWQNRVLQGAPPGDAILQRAMTAYNERRYREAFDRLAQSAPPTLASVAGLAYVIGDLAHEMRPGELELLRTLARQAARQNAADRRAQDFAQAADWFARITILSRDRRSVLRLLAPGPEHNPFFHRARLFQARYHYAAAREGADATRLREALDQFAALRQQWPEDLALREFAGERVVWAQELIRPESDGPAWARHLQELFARQHAILNWWCTRRQSPDGQLGGGWGDDVEILRTWVSVACISSAGETAIAGIERLAEGVWRHALRDGYSPDIGDVEHSAEPSADALLPMLLLRHGDPLWIERNLESARTIRERFMGVNQRKRLQFLSAEFGTDGVNRHPSAGGDTGYHARAMRHFLWLAWCGIPAAREAYLQWCDTWAEATMTPIGSKPAGCAPASLFFPSGSIHPPSGRAWHDRAAHYYGFPGLPTMIHDSLLAAHYLSRDRRYLAPVQAMLDLATTGPLRHHDPKLPADDPQNLLTHLAHQATPDITAVYRWLTGERVYDEYTLRQATPYQRFLLDGDRARLEASFQPLAESLRHGWTQCTSEVLQTDRAGLSGATEVLQAYTGAVRDFRDAATPTLAVTWITLDLNFAALVTEATPERVRARLYSFNSGSVRIGLRPWQLVPGTYHLMAGEAVPGERPGQERYTWSSPQEVAVRRRAEAIWVELPPRHTWVVDLRLKEAQPVAALRPDLAIHARDLRLERDKLIVTVHNVGAVPSAPCTVRCEVLRDGQVIRTLRAPLPALPPVRGFAPSTRQLQFKLGNAPEHGAHFRVRVDAADQVDEMCEENNTAHASN